MNYIKERQQIVDYGKQLLVDNLTSGTGGNISIYIPEDGVMLISPSGIPYGDTTVEDIVVMNLDGEVVEGIRKPSSEYDMHRIFYKKRKDVRSVIHTHSDYATALACLHQEIPPLHYLVGVIGKTVKCCAYKTFGTYELAEEAYATMGEDKGVLLGNHGDLGVGMTIEEAYNVVQTIEFLARIYTYSKSIAEPVTLSEEALNDAVVGFQEYGQKK